MQRCHVGGGSRCASLTAVRAIMQFVHLHASRSIHWYPCTCTLCTRCRRKRSEVLHLPGVALRKVKRSSGGPQEAVV